MSGASDRFSDCVAFVLKEEGGFTNDPRDPGGATNLGITMAELAAWRGAAVSTADVQSLQEPEARRIYWAHYWMPCWCVKLPRGLDLMVFDAAVNTGVGHGVKWLQSAIGVTVDGVIGPKTLAAAASCPIGETIQAMADARRDYYRSLRTFSTFGRGWFGRVDRCVAQAIG